MDGTKPIDRLLDVFVFAPIGVAAALRDDLAGLAANGRREVELARELGRITVRVGRRQVGKRREGRAAVTPTATTGTTAAAPARSPSGPRAAGGDAVRLPIADYDSLAASQVIARLGALEAGELDAVRAYELAHRGRRTILGKIAQLQAS